MGGEDAWDNLQCLEAQVTGRSRLPRLATRLSGQREANALVGQVVNRVVSCSPSASSFNG